MKFKVNMTAFGTMDQVRIVDVPDEELADRISYYEERSRPIPDTAILDLIYLYGQNDFQPDSENYSVSMGDVIELNQKYYLVEAIGFREMTPEIYRKYLATPRRD